jgi:glycosyltransferase involved in cell wall biosynthesis
MASVTVVCCAEIADPNWRWVEPHFSNSEVVFKFARCPQRRIYSAFRFINLARLLGCLEAVKIAQKNGARVIVAHGPTLAAWCALFARLLRLKAPILAHSFNFTTLPGPLKRAVFRFALSSVERFVVFSQVEKLIYSKSFDLVDDRFDFVHWGVRAPLPDPLDRPLEHGDYVAAIGGNARDYPTLIEAAWKLKDVRFVLVVRPENLVGLKLPPNVSVHTNIPFGKAMNVLAFSRFMVLPLIAGDVPCGHVTLVAAMHLGKAMVVTDSIGVRDYVHGGENSLAVAAGSMQDLAHAVDRLWQDQELCRRLGENGRTFATSECTETRIAEHFRNYLFASNRPGIKIDYATLSERLGK